MRFLRATIYISISNYPLHAAVVLSTEFGVQFPFMKPSNNGLSISLGLGQGLQRIEVLVKAVTLVYSQHSTKIQAERQTVDKR